MADQTMRGFIQLALDQIAEDGKQWIEVVPLADKTRNGPYYFTITADDLETYAQFVRDNPDRIPIDYDHMGDKQESSVAAGWFTGLAEVADRDGIKVLRAEVEWTPQAQEEIRSKRYRFISAVTSFLKKDAKSGLMTGAKSLLAATLTNRPFFKELSAVAEDLVESADLDALADEYGDVVAALAVAGLAYGDETAREHANKLIAAVWTTAFVNDLPDSSFLHIEAGGSKDGDGKTTPRSLRHFPVKDGSGKIDLPHVRNALARIPQSNLPAAAKESASAKAQSMLKNAGGTSQSADTEGDEQMTDYLKALGIADDAPDAEKFSAALNKLSDEKLDLQAKLAEAESKLGEIDKQNERIAELEKKDRDRDVEVLLASAVDKGKVLPREKETLSELFSDNVAGLKTLLAQRPEGFAVRTRETGSGGKGPTFEDPDTAALGEEMGIDPSGDQIDDESARLHLRAMAILKERGKEHGFTDDDYRQALYQAQRVGVAA